MMAIFWKSRKKKKKRDPCRNKQMKKEKKKVIMREGEENTKGTIWKTGEGRPSQELPMQLFPYQNPSLPQKSPSLGTCPQPKPANASPAFALHYSKEGHYIKSRVGKFTIPVSRSP